MSFEIVNGYAVLPDSFHKNWIIETGRLDHNVSLHKELNQYIKPEMVCVDAGAHIGTETIWLTNQVGFDGKVICFEANPNAFQCLQYNCLGLKNVELYNKALGSRDGFVDIVEVKDNYGMSYIKDGGTIPMVTIDSLNLQQCNFIKIDCEGAEPDILEGAEETIKKFKPILFIEINSEALERNGYTPTVIFEKLLSFGYTFRNIYDTEKMEGIQYDIICQSL